MHRRDRLAGALRAIGLSAANWPDRFLAQIVDRFLDRAGRRVGLVGDPHGHLLPARGLLVTRGPSWSGRREAGELTSG